MYVRAGSHVTSPLATLRKGLQPSQVSQLITLCKLTQHIRWSQATSFTFRTAKNGGLSPKLLQTQNRPRVAANMHSNAANGSQSMHTRTDFYLFVTHGDYVLLANMQGPSTRSYGPLSGTIQGDEQQHQAAARTAKQLAGINIEERSLKQIHGTPLSLQAQTCKQGTQPSASGLNLLQGKALECANEVRLQAHEVETVLANPPPMLQLDQASVADAKWFNRRWVTAQSKGQVPAAPFRLGTSQDDQSPSAVHAWLEQAQTDSPIDQVPDVVIETGVFKYVLLVVTDVAQGRSKLIVRGDRQSGYHMDVFEKVVTELSPHKLHVAQPLGGGRIRHDDGAKAITVYGYSSAYGQAPHDLSVAIIKQWYPMYASDKIIASYEGY